ncbi:MAG: LacI family transcriptional regulator [Desulfovibrionaceae bacterium]|nr:LacI family transcriptional regulator [Desulfovibrionaceae bacterium]MBF0513665.1 LacI family transcriptional regulator [Desulfovibrionaceae bacterium]
MTPWLEILRARVEASSQAEVAKALDISRTAICQVLAGKYPAKTGRIEAKVLALFGATSVACPVRGEIAPAECSETRERARTIGLRAGNPETVKLFKSCLNCPVLGPIHKGGSYAVAKNRVGKGKAQRAHSVGRG